MADDEGEYFYLEPGFDPATLTVPRLRNILLTHDVQYPSNAKKSQLLQHFNDELVPQAKKLLTASKRVKRSNRGIVDVPSSQASTIDEDEVAVPLPSTSSRRASRRQPQALEDDSDVTLLPPSESSVRGRRTTQRVVKSSEPEIKEEEPAPARLPSPVKKARGRPLKTPKVEAQDPPIWHKVAEDSPFTADNPFQSGGSSPPAEARQPDRRRRTMEVGTLEKRKSTGSRRRTDGVVPAPQTSTFGLPVSRISSKRSAGTKQELVPAGEEFTPEESQELALQEASGQVVRAYPRRGPSSASAIVQAVVWPLAILALASAGLWSQEKYSVGYCGVGNPPRTEFKGVEVPDWADSLRPGCEPCPPHAYCYQNLETKCEDGFILKHHPLTLNGLVPVPLPPSCEPDGEQARKVQHVVDRAIEVLRERNAKYECGEPLAGESKAPSSPAMAEADLKATLSVKKTKRMSDEEFDKLFHEAVGEIISRDEIISTGTTGAGSLRSNSRARQSFSCALRTSIRLLFADIARGVRHQLARYFWPITLILLAASGTFYGKQQIEWRGEKEERAKDLARQAFDRLSTHATLHMEDPDSYPEPFLLVSHLRDQILNEDVGRKWVQDLWASTMSKVKKNSNIRELNQEMRKGDYGLTWEWIGPLAALPESGASRRISSGTSSRKSGRYSILPPASSPLSGLSTVPPSEEQKSPEMSMRKWDEGRAIY